MPDSPRSFSGTEFIDKLEKDDITVPVVFTGMVKKSEEGRASFLFAVGGDCDNWIQVPVSSVEKVEVLEIVPCRTHSHPLVNLYLKPPKSPEAQLFSALAQGGWVSHSALGIGRLGPLPPPLPGTSPDATPYYSYSNYYYYPWLWTG